MSKKLCFFLSSNTVILQEIICRKYTEIFIMLCAQSNSLQLLLMFLNLKQPMLCMGFPGVIVVKNLSANEGDIWDTGSIPGSGRSPGGVHGNPLQYSGLGSSMDRGTWWAIVHRVAKSRTRLKQLSTCVIYKIYDVCKLPLFLYLLLHYHFHWKSLIV